MCHWTLGRGRKHVSFLRLEDSPHLHDRLTTAKARHLLWVSHTSRSSGRWHGGHAVAQSWRMEAPVWGQQEPVESWLLIVVNAGCLRAVNDGSRSFVEGNHPTLGLITFWIHSFCATARGHYYLQLSYRYRTVAMGQEHGTMISRFAHSTDRTMSCDSNFKWKVICCPGIGPKETCLLPFER